MDREVMLEVIHAQKVYTRGSRRTPALADLHFRVEQDELVSIVGPSGCGKTTMLRCIAGLLPTTKGQVLLDGRSATRPPRAMALVFQDCGRSLCAWRSVWGNVSFGLEATYVPRAARERRVREALELVGLADTPTTIRSSCPAACSSASSSRVR
jgi:NitT/TauT family transport system ATP-binding protein